MDALKDTSKTFLAVVIWALALSSSLLAAESAQPIIYNLKVRLEPESADVSVRGVVEFSSAGSRTFKFNLHETFAIHALRVNGKPAQFSFATAERSPMIPTAKLVVVTLPPDVPPGNLRMEIEYAGRLEKLPEFGEVDFDKPAMDDQMNAHLVQLTGCSSWYPQFGFGGVPVTAEFEASLPRGWIAIGSGAKLAERVEAGRSITHWRSPKDLDLLIVASPDFQIRSYRRPGVNIEIFHTRMPEKFVEGEAQQIANVMAFYTGRLGETSIPGGTIRHVYSPLRYGQGKAGTARPGLIVTSEGVTLGSLAADPHFSLFQPIAHEIAHFWWNFGAGQGDWINEASAEYFSALAVRAISSPAEFKSIMEDYRKQVVGLPAGAPSLATVPWINDGDRYVVRYFKGALMLEFLREKLGDEKFYAVCREFFQTYHGESAGTPEFRRCWKGKLGAQGELVDLWLDSPGGLPGAIAPAS